MEIADPWVSLLSFAAVGVILRIEKTEQGPIGVVGRFVVRRQPKPKRAAMGADPVAALFFGPTVTGEEESGPMSDQQHPLLADGWMSVPDAARFLSLSGRRSILMEHGDLPTGASAGLEASSHGARSPSSWRRANLRGGLEAAESSRVALYARRDGLEPRRRLLSPTERFNGGCPGWPRRAPVTNPPGRRSDEPWRCLRSSSSPQEPPRQRAAEEGRHITG